MVLKIERKKPTAKAVSKAGKGKARAPVAAGKGAGEGRVDRFEGLGRIVGGGGPSEIISTTGPGQRRMAPLTAWEKYDIDHDPYFREARERMRAYRNLPEPWKRKVDQWGRKVSDEMKYAIAKELMKKRESKSG